MTEMESERTIWFFVEFPSEYVQNFSFWRGWSRERALFDFFYHDAGQSIIDELHKLQEMGLKVGLVLAVAGFDQTGCMVELIKMLNVQEIPVKIWITVPDNLGYWTNMSPYNVHNTCTLIMECINKINEYKLNVVSFGIDLEKPIQFIQKGRLFKKLGLILDYLYFSIKDGKKNRVKLKAYFEKANEHGVGIEIYKFPHIIDWFFGVPKLRIKDSRIKYVNMSYTSLCKGIWRRLFEFVSFIGYFESEYPAIGIVGEDEYNTPGRNFGDKKVSHLDKESFVRVLKIASKKSSEVWIFALDGFTVLKWLGEYLKLNI